VSQLFGMLHHLLLGPRIGQQLSCSRVNPERSNATEHAFARQREHDGHRPVNALADG
jgi:hypothetical protein